VKRLVLTVYAVMVVGFCAGMTGVWIYGLIAS